MNSHHFSFIIKMYYFIFIALGLSASLDPSQGAKPHPPKLLVVAYGGFRYDYLDLDITPHLNELKKRSTYGKCLLNVFPTLTSTNLFSLATGMYSEVHGVISNTIYDQKTQRVIKYSHELYHYNKNIVPIWTLNELAGEEYHSGVMMWSGGDFDYMEVNTTFVMKKNKNIPWEERVETMLKWFLDPKTPANLVMIYFEQPDEESHSSGPAPGSPKTIEQIKRTDNVTKDIMDALVKNSLEDVNVVFLSDHGMEGVTLQHVIDLTKFVGGKVDFYGNSPVLQVYPKPGVSVNEVYSKLNDAANENKHFKVYLKADIPEHLHIKDCERTPPVLVVAEPTYAFQDYYDEIDWQIKNRGGTPDSAYGIHGYDPLTVNMHPYFIANGPLFKKNHYAEHLRTIDMYPLFAHVLKLYLPPLKPNGTLFGIEHIFNGPL